MKTEVSHDRDFLDRLVTSTIVLEGDGTATEYAGGYGDYVAQRGPRGGADRRHAVPREGQGARRAEAGRTGQGTPRLQTRTRPGRAAQEDQDLRRPGVATLQQALADPDLYRRDPKSFQAKTTRIGTARPRSKPPRTEWLELEMLREELGG